MQTVTPSVRLSDRQSNRKMDHQPVRETNTVGHIVRQTGTETDGQTCQLERHSDRQSGRQTVMQSDMQTVR